MDDFRFGPEGLRCEQVPLAEVARRFGTPAYVYSSATLRSHFDRLRSAFAAVDPLICFSVKSCGNLHVLRLLRDAGAGFDVVSGGELHRALRAGGDPKKIVFAGVGKTDDEISAALRAGVGLLNVESPAELENLSSLAVAAGSTARAALRINPDVDARTHAYTTTGRKETKFGVDFDRAAEVFDRARRLPGVHLCGLHLHIGSPVNAVDPYVAAIRRALDLTDELRREGHAIDTLDIGGGFGAHYRGSEAPDAAAYAAAVVPLLAGRGLSIVVEPGRSIAANAGLLLTRVLYVKQSGAKRFAIVDAGMNDLVRPALYDAYHFIWPVAPPPHFVPHDRARAHELGDLLEYDVVGPVCETGDFLGRGRRLPPLARGDLIAVFTAGAYGMSMASQYNSRPRPPEVLVAGAEPRLIRRRERYDDLWAAELDAGAV